MCGPGHQSSDYGFMYFHDSYEMDDIKEHLRDKFDNFQTNYSFNFWEVERPPAKYVESRTKSAKEKIKIIKKRIKRLESTTCFVPEEVEGEDPVLIKNISGCIMYDLLERLHKAGFMYGAEDISKWEQGGKQLCEPRRSKILNIMRSWI